MRISKLFPHWFSKLQQSGFHDLHNQQFADKINALHALNRIGATPTKDIMETGPKYDRTVSHLFWHPKLGRFSLQTNKNSGISKILHHDPGSTFRQGSL